MIEGLKVDFTGTDLKSHLDERKEHHEQRAAFYQKQVDAFIKEASDAEVRHGQNTYQTTKKTLEDQMLRHEKAVPFFAILADHIVENETYRLALSDLQTLELFGANNYSNYF